MQALNAPQWPHSLDKDQVKNPTVERQQTLKNEGYKYSSFKEEEEDMNLMDSYYFILYVKKFLFIVIMFKKLSKHLEYTKRKD